MAQRSGEMEFSMYVREGDTLLEVVDQFKYLGRTLDQYDKKWTSIYRNIRRACNF